MFWTNIIEGAFFVSPSYDFFRFSFLFCNFSITLFWNTSPYFMARMNMATNSTPNAIRTGKGSDFQFPPNTQATKSPQGLNNTSSKRKCCHFTFVIPARIQITSSGNKGSKNVVARNTSVLRSNTASYFLISYQFFNKGSSYNTRHTKYNDRS